MTIEELVRHPWLTEEVPDTLLQSPVYMANKVCVIACVLCAVVPGVLSPYRKAFAIISLIL